MTLDFGYSSPKQGLKKKNKSDLGKKKNLLWKFLFQPEGWEFWGQKAKSRMPGHLSQEGQLSRHTFRVDSKGGFPVTQMVKSLPAMWETQMWPLEKEMTLLSVFLPGESHGQRSLVGSSGVTKSWLQLRN